MRLRINLLSPERKQRIVSLRWFHFALKQCLNVFLLTILVFCFVRGIGWLLHNQSTLVASSANDKQKVEVSQELAGYQEEIKKANSTIRQIMEREAQHPRWSQLFSKLESITPDSITLYTMKNIDYRLSISGFAKDRDSLMEFRDRLSHDDCFEDVQLPLSDLFSQESVDFQMDVSLRKNCLKNTDL